MILGIKFQIVQVDIDDEGKLTKIFKDVFVKNKNATEIYKKRSDIIKKMPDIYNDLERRIQEHQNFVMQSSWRYVKVYSLFVEFYKTKKLRCSSYIKTPEKYSNAKC